MKNNVFRICRTAGDIDSNRITTPYTLAATFYLYSRIFAGIPDKEPMFLLGMLVGLMGFSFLLVTLVTAVVFESINLVTYVFFKENLDRDREEEKNFLDLVKHVIYAMPGERQEHYFHLVTAALEYDHSGDN